MTRIELKKILTLTCYLLVANILFSQDVGIYARFSTNEMFQNQNHNIPFKKIEFGACFDFDEFDDRNLIGIMYGVQIYLYKTPVQIDNAYRMKFIMPVYGTYTHYFRNRPSFYTKVGIGFSLPGVRPPDYTIKIAGFSAFTEFGYRLRVNDNNYVTAALGFDMQQARTVNAVYSSVSKNLVFLGPSVSLRVNLSSSSATGPY